jgi:leucyl/phenylalanyl-tRNA--protein transferase
MPSLTTDILLRAYGTGIFPMARNRHDTKLYWIDPDQRGIIPLDAFHAPRSLRKVLKQNVFEVRINTAFDAVIQACAEPTPDRPDTWINDEIVRLFGELHRMGMAHSVESWADGRLVGGLYGLSLGGAFFGESMFSRATDASKVALVHLVARLKHGGYSLLDTQFVTDHLERFGALEIPRHRYLRLLARAVELRGQFRPDEMVDWRLAVKQ